MWPDWISNPEHLPLESDALPTALRLCVCVRERERRGVYTILSPVGKPLLKKNDSQFFLGAKTTTCTWKSFHTFRATKQTFIPENSVMQYKTRQHWRKCF